MICSGNPQEHVKWRTDDKDEECKTGDHPEATAVAQVSERHWPLLQVDVEMANLRYMVNCSEQNSVGHGSRTREKSARVKGWSRPCVCFLGTVKFRAGLLLPPGWLRLGEWGMAGTLEREGGCGKKCSDGE